MNIILFRKTLYDLRWPLLLVGLLLAGYEAIWVKITERITSQIIPLLLQLTGRPLAELEAKLMVGGGEVFRALLGGQLLDLTNAQSTLSIAYVHPFVLTLFCVWPIGRAAGALAGEIDRGTMELLLAQPVSRRKVVLTHLAVDLVTIPVLCLLLFAGTWFGMLFVDLPRVDLFPFLVSLTNAAGLMFAVSGYTMALSAFGRFRWRVVSLSLGLALVQFLVNLLGQLWDVLAPCRPLTVFYYYQPQPVILGKTDPWMVFVGREWPWLGGSGTTVHVLGILTVVGVLGYGVALWQFSRRDLPAPL